MLYFMGKIHSLLAMAVVMADVVDVAEVVEV
jgi:hypothetical protein